MDKKFKWTELYMELATALLKYKNNRGELLELLKEIYPAAGMNYPFKERGIEPYDDICPFTVFGSFNRGITHENRAALLREFKTRFNLKSEVPEKVFGIPVVMNLSAWFFAYKEGRGEDDIDNLWELFEAALTYSEKETDDARNAFIAIYDTVIKQKQVKWNITMGLYWVRPYTFINLDATNKHFITNSENLSVEFREIFYGNIDNLPNGKTYIEMCEKAKEMLSDKEKNFHSFPELSYGAWENHQENVLREKDTVISNYDNNETRYWIYSPGEKACMWDEFYDDGIMGIGWDRVSDLKAFSSKEQIKEFMKKNINSNLNYINDAHCLWQFANDIKIGDVIFVKKGVYKIIGRGIVASDYIYDDTRKTYKHVRKVNWTHKGEWDHPSRAITKTLTDISSYIEEVQKIKEIFTNDTLEEESEQMAVSYEPYFKEDFLEEVFMSEDDYDTLTDLVENKYNVILQGAPGVGKTFVATRLAYSMMGEKDNSRIAKVQFHQSYSYEDFIQGYRPSGEGFERVNGIFYEFCKEAEKDNERLYFFIIDEINRGNLSKIFGELMMLIEKDKRGENIQLLYSKDKFTVPSNIRIIGTMNTADRSLAMIDYALRRRFAFYDFKPAFENDGFKNYLQTKNSEKLTNLIKAVEALNSKIAEDESLGEGFMIGHSYFMTDGEITDNWLSAVIEFEIIPLIKEYWFDEPANIRDEMALLRSAIK